MFVLDRAHEAVRDTAKTHHNTAAWTFVVCAGAERGAVLSLATAKQTAVTLCVTVQHLSSDQQAPSSIRPHWRRRRSMPSQRSRSSRFPWAQSWTKNMERLAMSQSTFRGLGWEHAVAQCAGSEWIKVAHDNRKGYIGRKQRRLTGQLLSLNDLSDVSICLSNSSNVRSTDQTRNASESGSSEEEEQNVWNQMLELVTVHECSLALQRCLREKDLCIRALSCHFAPDVICLGKAQAGSDCWKTPTQRLVWLVTMFFVQELVLLGRSLCLGSRLHRRIIV